MSRTKRHDLNGNIVNDGKCVSNACLVETDGEQVKHECMESADPAFYNPVFKKELKRRSSKAVRRISKAHLREDEVELETNE